MNQYLVPTFSHQNWFLYSGTTPSVRLVANLGSKFPNHQLVLEIQAAFGSHWHHTIGSFGGIFVGTTFWFGSAPKFLTVYDDRMS